MGYSVEDIKAESNSDGAGQACKVIRLFLYFKLRACGFWSAEGEKATVIMNRAAQLR